MGGAASQDSYHHGRALQLVVIHARKLRTKTRQPGYLKQESWSAQSAGEQEQSQIGLPGFGVLPGQAFLVHQSEQQMLWQG